LVAYITDPSRRDFQPMNANYGLIPDLKIRARGRQRKIEMGARALATMDDWIAHNRITPVAAEAPAAAEA
jgi:methylenetetrahydrofolate--tRNA-(uracil-5-)-methyltransferase